MKGYHLIIVLLVSIFSGCGNEVSTTTKDASTTITSTILDGTWIEECQFVSSSSTSTKEIFAFSSSNFTATNSYTSYSGTNCNNKSFILRMKVNNISIGSKSTLENYLIVTKYTAVILDYTLEPSTTAVATVYNNASYCGVTSWSSGSETSIAGKTCSSNSISSVNDGFKNIIQMNSERTYIRTGNTSDLGSDGYPKTVYGNKFYKEN
jgi:hypothetical protein